MAAINAIPGVTDAKIEELRAAGIRTTDDLLEQANTPRRREKLAGTRKVTEKQLLTWVQLAELMRVRGVSGSSAELLVSARVGSLKELKGADAEALAATLDKKNSARKNPPLKRAPSSKVVQKWIDEARGLKPTVRA